MPTRATAPPQNACCASAAGIHVRFEKDAATGASHALALPELDAYLSMDEVAPLENGDD